MSVLLALLVAGHVQSSPADSSGCTALADGAPAVAADVWGTVALHNGVVRWDVARGPLRLWVQPRPAGDVTPGVPGVEWQRAVLDAASAWRNVAPGLSLRAVRDSADADVIVTWVPDLRAVDGAAGLAWRTAGRTTLEPAEDGRATTAHVRLAIATPTGARYGIDDIRAVARHELGHALGLGHHAAANSVMAPLVRVDQLNSGDRAALRLLYALPIGARCTQMTAAR